MSVNRRSEEGRGAGNGLDELQPRSDAQPLEKVVESCLGSAHLDVSDQDRGLGLHVAARQQAGEVVRVRDGVGQVLEEGSHREERSKAQLLARHALGRQKKNTTCSLDFVSTRDNRSNRV